MSCTLYHFPALSAVDKERGFTVPIGSAVLCSPTGLGQGKRGKPGALWKSGALGQSQKDMARHSADVKGFVSREVN
jgi:hypothetical protein